MIPVLVYVLLDQEEEVNKQEEYLHSGLPVYEGPGVPDY